MTTEARATVALVGDRAQLPAVGRGGVLDMAVQARGRSYDMTELHRFTDPEYATLTLTMRDRENPGEVFDQLAAMGLVSLHDSEDDARTRITEQAQRGEAITVATNEEAAALNERIRAGRVERGEVDDQVTATGSDGLSVGAGDLIQTRKNDTTLGVANRQQWTAQHVTEDGTAYAREVGDPAKKARRVVALPAEYVDEHAHLSYAATAYGVQGATVNTAHAVLSDATTAAGIYVGMTRGRETNRLHAVAENLADARARFIAAMERDPADRCLDHSTTQAAEAVRGLIADGPVQRVNEAIAALIAEAEQAERQAARWAQTAARFDTQRARHRAENNEAAALLRAAETEAERMRTEVAVPLTEQAEADGAAYLAAAQAEAPRQRSSPPADGSADAKPAPNSRKSPRTSVPFGLGCEPPSEPNLPARPKLCLHGRHSRLRTTPNAIRACLMPPSPSRSRPQRARPSESDTKANSSRSLSTSTAPPKRTAPAPGWARSTHTDRPAKLPREQPPHDGRPRRYARCPSNRPPHRSKHNGSLPRELSSARLRERDISATPSVATLTGLIHDARSQHAACNAARLRSLRSR